MRSSALLDSDGRATPYLHQPHRSSSGSGSGRGSSSSSSGVTGSSGHGGVAGLSSLALAQAAQFAAFLTAAGYDANYVATANAAAQVALAQQPLPLLDQHPHYQHHQSRDHLLDHQPPPLPQISKIAHELEPGQYKVGRDSVCKSVAGKIATDFRVGVQPSLVAKGEAVSVAIKAIALACTYLVGNEVMVACQPYHKPLLEGDETDRRTCVLVLKKVPLAPLELGVHIVKVASTSEFTRVAGSIARTLRKSASVTIQAFGPSCISIAVDAVVLARRMLKSEPDGTPVATPLDFSIVPKFMSVDGDKEPGDNKSSGIQFHVFVKK